jgi:hypothetical protein
MGITPPILILRLYYTSFVATCHFSRLLYTDIFIKISFSRYFFLTYAYPILRTHSEKRRGKFMAFRLRVKEILEERKIPVGRMSREANVPITMARKMVKDPNYIPSIPTLDKVAKYLGVSIEELYTNDDEAGAPGAQ